MATLLYKVAIVLVHPVKDSFQSVALPLVRPYSVLVVWTDISFLVTGCRFSAVIVICI